MGTTIANLRDQGHSVDVDDEAVARMEAFVTALAASVGLSHRGPGDYDRNYFKHQIRGGVMGTMLRQLMETKREHLLPQVLNEVVKVRAEFGYPIMVTPFNQLVATQAMRNVTSAERYQTVPDEVTRYVPGRFGTPAMPKDKNVEDRIKSSKRAKELEGEAKMASLDELRARIGKAYSDEEFLLRAVMPADQVDAMVAAGPARRGYDPKTKPALDLIRELATRKGIGSVKIDKPGFKLELNGGRYDVPHPIRALVFDIDGTLAKMDKETGTYQALPGAIDALSFARDRGMPVVVYTNGTFFPPAHAGLNLDDGHIVTPAVVATGFF